MQVSGYKTRLKLKYGELTQYLDWCERNCIGKFRYMEDPFGSMYDSWVFLFEDERDYITFLVWKK